MDKSALSFRADDEAVDIVEPNNRLNIGIVSLRRRHKWTYFHFTVHIFCLFYWMSGSLRCASTSYSPTSDAALTGQESGARADAINIITTLSKVESKEGTRDAQDTDDSFVSTHGSPTATSFVKGVQDYPARFPRQVWQTASKTGRQKWAKLSRTWRGLDGWQYNFLSDDDADEFVRSHFNETSPAIVHFWNSLAIPVIKADFLRYLIMFASGGIYADIDTDVITHPDQWIPREYGEQQVNAVIGIEYDDSTYPLFVRPVSFSQWTLMSKPGHPIFEIAVQRMMSNLEFMARRSHVETSELVPTQADILQGTGPCMITDVVIQVIRDQGYDLDWTTFHHQKIPVLFGDVLILPINAFAGGQKHSNSGNPEYGPRFVGHHFGRSWYRKGKDRLDV